MNTYHELFFLLDGIMELWCLFIRTLRCAFLALRSRMVFLIQQKNSLRVASKLHIEEGVLLLCSTVLQLLGVTTSENMIPRPCFQALKHRLFPLLLHVCAEILGHLAHLTILKIPKAHVVMACGGSLVPYR